MTQRQGLRIVVLGRNRPLTPERAVDRARAIIAVLRHFLPDITIRIERDDRSS